jgi:ATP-dependent DNA ligase
MLWRIPSSRSRRIPPAGFIQPARPLLTTIPRSGPEWIHEIKFDGYGLIARKEAGRVVLWSRYGTDYSDTFLRIAEAIRALPVDHVMIDGEAVVFRPDGHSDFTALRTDRGAAQASLVAYDLLQFEGEDWRRLALEVRRANWSRSSLESTGLRSARRSRATARLCSITRAGLASRGSSRSAWAAFTRAAAVGTGSR